MCVTALCATACASDDAAETATTVPPRASSASYLLSEPDAAALVEWTVNNGDVIGNVTVATVNTMGMNVEQAVTPITGFVTPEGDVGLEYGKGDVAVNLTGQMDGDALNGTRRLGSRNHGSRRCGRGCLQRGGRRGRRRRRRGVGRPGRPRGG